MPKVFIKTYGCQMNERDSEQVAQMLAARGYERTVEEREADVVLLNTCSVRDMAEQKAIGKMGMLERLRKNRPHLVFGYLGCMAQSRGSELLDASPHVDLVVGTQRFHRVADHVDTLYRAKIDHLMDDLRRPIVDIDPEFGSQNTIRDHTLADRQVTAFVSIMQGCNMRCSFCIVPDTRGPERARPIADIVEEVRTLASKGIREVTLLGQIVNLYGRHELPRLGDKSPFVQLLEAVHTVEGIDRIRFTSPHPIGFRADLIAAIARLPKLVEHIHLPLQSGSDRILKRMRRTYTRDKFRALTSEIRESIPGVAITTDIIVGFPGETEADYAETAALTDEIGFDNAFVFRYSQRKATPAANLEAQLPETVKEARNHDLLAIVDRHARRTNEALIGQRVEILCEGLSKTNAARLTGRTRTNKIVIFEGQDRHIGQLLPVQITGTTGFTLYGDPVVHD